MKDEFIIDGYAFASRTEYDRAKKEQETILYLNANTNMEDMKEVYKIYKTAVEKRAFQTVFGLKFMEGLRKKLGGSGIVEEDVLEPIPVARVYAGARKNATADAINKKQAEQYKEKYERAKSGSIIKNILIAVLTVVIALMLFFTYKSQYSVFTYFTDYKENMREELLNEYEEWEAELKEREENLNQREQQMGQQ